MTPQADAAARRWTLVATILGSSLTFIDGTAVNVALPALQADLHATIADVQWVIEAYTLFLSGLIIVGGSLGDQFGRKRMFLGGVVLFRRAKDKAHTFGRALIGLGLVLTALHQFLSLLQPIVASPAGQAFLAQVGGYTPAAVIVAAVLTWAAHSSVVTVLLAMSLASAGVVPLETGVALVVGANLGSALVGASRYSEGIPELERALGLQPSSTEVLNNLGIYYAKKNDYARALDYWNRSLSIQPQQPLIRQAADAARTRL